MQWMSSPDTICYMLALQTVLCLHKPFIYMERVCEHLFYGQINYVYVYSKHTLDRLFYIEDDIMNTPQDGPIEEFFTWKFLKHTLIKQSKAIHK